MRKQSDLIFLIWAILAELWPFCSIYHFDHYSPFWPLPKSQKMILMTIFARKKSIHGSLYMFLRRKNCFSSLLGVNKFLVTFLYKIQQVLWKKFAFWRGTNYLEACGSITICSFFFLIMTFSKGPAESCTGR